MAESSADLLKLARERLPAELSDFLVLAGQTAGEIGLKLYLAGGVVRDLLLGRPNQDLDLVTEGDAAPLAREIARLVKGRAVHHSRFMTATVRWENWSVDLATARSESYAGPGALPVVQPGDIAHDLVRRDFTINAMAVRLSPPGQGQLLDLYGGRRDLEGRIIRILHDASFQDDSTRIWRAIRYEQRLDFTLEPHSLELLSRDLPYLSTVSGERVSREFQLVLQEEKPERAVARAAALGILEQMQPPLKIEAGLLAQFARLRVRLQPYAVPPELYLALLVYPMRPEELEQLNSYLKFTRITYHVLKDTLKLKSDLPALSAPGLPASTVYNLLQPRAPLAVLANLFATRSCRVKESIDLYLNRLRQVQTHLGAQDLLDLGLPPGPSLKKVLRGLLEARLDGQADSREDELTWVRKTAGIGKN
jgi:tRNA nucleotidyltransferase (CCA-adding enzyme)